MKAGSHSLDKRDFEERYWGDKPKQLSVPKPKAGP